MFCEDKFLFPALVLLLFSCFKSVNVFTAQFTHAFTYILGI